MSVFQKVPFRMLVKFMGLWPPYLGAGIKVIPLDDSGLKMRVQMPLRVYNRNYVNTHFGGSLYSMVDPFYMLILINKIGKDYLVWDKSACIRFKKPGKGLVHADFEINDEKVEEIVSAVREKGKCEPIFTVEIRDENNQVIAEVEKTLWVKKK